MQVTRTSLISRTSSNFGQIRPRTAELAALVRLKKFPQTNNGENLVSNLAHSFLIGSSSLLQVTRATIKAWISSNFGRIPPLTSELAALERLKKTTYNLVSTLAFLIGSSSFLQVWRTTTISRTSSKFGRIRPQTVELAALERLKKLPLTYNGENLVSTLEPLFISFLQVTRTTIKAWISSNFGGIPLVTSVLVALERLKNQTISLLAL